MAVSANRAVTQESNEAQQDVYNFAILSDANIQPILDKVIEFLHKKDLVSTIELTGQPVCKGPNTAILSLEEDFQLERLDEVNNQLVKQFGNNMRMVDWIQYQNEHSEESDDSDGSNIMVADNTGVNKRGHGMAVYKRRMPTQLQIIK